MSKLKQFCLSYKSVNNALRLYTSGNMNKLVQLYYNEKHVPIKSDTVGRADQKMSAPDHFWQKHLLSKMPFKKGRLL